MEREKKQIVLDNWLRDKIYQLTDTSYKKIKSAIGSRRIDLLSQQENFLREMILIYRRTYGEWPTALKGDFN